uniref:Uncharacterized protein n=1 Tax=Oryza sativa subsp. japonica TaxID=39947 RepID=Q10I75_ORYSJ|nr:hypothetical protein LOC_Os03g36380 [Oryza sativa Japonica Group]
MASDGKRRRRWHRLQSNLKKQTRDIRGGERGRNGSEEEDDDDASSKKKKMAVVAIKEAPSLFAPLCLMAEGSSKVLYEELKTSRERLTISHEKLKEAHDNLLSTTQHGAHIDVGISCDLLDDSASCHIPHVASSSISTSCDDLIYMPSSSSSSCVSICDASLVVENNELKEQVVKLNKSLERCFKGKEYS